MFFRILNAVLEGGVCQQRIDLCGLRVNKQWETTKSNADEY
jgi:hypothetical protein